MAEVSSISPQLEGVKEGRKVLVFHGEKVQTCFYEHDEPGNPGVRMANKRSSRTDTLLFLSDERALALAHWILKRKEATWKNRFDELKEQYMAERRKANATIGALGDDIVRLVKSFPDESPKETYGLPRCREYLVSLEKRLKKIGHDYSLAYTRRNL